MQTGRWGFNGTGIPGHADYIQENELDKKDPFTDEDRTFAFNVHAADEAGGQIILHTFDGSVDPPPLSVISPQTHPHMYCILTVVYEDGHIGPFPNGARIPGYPEPATIFPLVSRYKIFYPADKVRPVAQWKMPY
jgi:hypothetical protein